MWRIGTTLLGWVTPKNRQLTIRHGSGFSNANLAEQWDDLDFIDIGKGEGGDYITGVLGHNDRLMIFKTNSTYALFGFDGDTFQLITISESIGMTAESTAVSTPYGVFFWNDRQGVYLYDGNNMVWLFEKLKPAIDDGRITFANPPQLGWANNKLYLSVDYYDADTATTSRRMFVYDPTIGAWVLWDVDAAALHTHHPPDGEPVLYGACVANTGRVVSIDAGGTNADRYTYSNSAYVSTNIKSYFQTAWIKTRNPIVKKRWGQIRLVTSAEQTGTLRVDVFHDYDTTTTAKRMADSELAYDVPVVGRESSASTWDTATYQLALGKAALLVTACGLRAQQRRLPTLRRLVLAARHLRCASGLLDLRSRMLRGSQQRCLSRISHGGCADGESN